MEASYPLPQSRPLGHSLPEIISNVRSEINTAAKAEQSTETDGLGKNQNFKSTGKKALTLG